MIAFQLQEPVFERVTSDWVIGQYLVYGSNTELWETHCSVVNRLNIDLLFAVSADWLAASNEARPAHHRAGLVTSSFRFEDAEQLIVLNGPFRSLG